VAAFPPHALDHRRPSRPSNALWTRLTLAPRPYPGKPGSGANTSLPAVTMGQCGGGDHRMAAQRAPRAIPGQPPLEGEDASGPSRRGDPVGPGRTRALGIKLRMIDNLSASSSQRHGQGPG